MTATLDRSTATGPSPAARPRRRRRHTREYFLFALFVLPNLVIITVFGLWPTLANLLLSFTEWNMISNQPTFVGLRNYRLLLSSSEFGAVIVTTAIFTVAVVGVNMSAGVLLAVLFDRPLKGRNVVRTLSFAPHVLSGAAIAMVWSFIFDPNYGLAKLFLEAVGLTSPNWLTSSRHALLAVIIVHIWKGVGFCAIVYLAALQGLPRDLYEAAEIDGAGRIRQFFSITVPLLSPTTFFLLVISVIGTVQAFDVIAVMTGGGPGTATTVLSWFIYEQGFKAFDFGKAAAGGMVLFLGLLLTFAVQRITLERKVHYQ